MSSRRPLCLICLLVVGAIYLFTGMSPPQPSWAVDECEGRTARVRGTVADRQMKNGTFQIYLTNVSFLKDQNIQGTGKYQFPEKTTGIIVKISESNAVQQYARLGSKIEAKGVFAPFDAPTCEGQFNMRTYYMIRGYEGQLLRARITGYSDDCNILFETLRRIRERSYAVLSGNMSADDAALVAAMTLGDRSGLGQEVKDLFQSAGISHVLALSGLHIASVGMALLAVLRKAGMNARAAAALSGTVIALYAIMTGLSTSTVRAMIMFAISVTAVILGRSYDLLSSAALSAVLIVIENPYYISDPGFLMSFGAVIGIACIFPLFDRLPELLAVRDMPASRSHGSRVKKRAVALYRAVCITVSVTLATLPVTASGFMQISLCSAVINLVVIPLMGVVLFTGFTGIIIGLIGLNPAFILKITHYILWFYQYLGKKSEKIDGNMLLIGKPEKWQSITYAIILISIVISSNIIFDRKKLNNTYGKSIDRTGRRYTNNNRRYAKNADNKIAYVIENMSDRRRRKKRNLLMICAYTVMLLCAFVIISLHPRSGLEIRNVDVGQGDCTLIWGDGIPAVMIDGGSSDVKQAGMYRILPVLKANRIEVIECCFLTHMDSDHVSGVIELLEDEGCPVKIRRIIVSDAVRSAGSAENFIRLSEAARRKGTEIISVSSGDAMRAGPVVLSCMSPLPEGAAVSDSGSPSTDENDNSIVLHLQYPEIDGYAAFSAIFTGDISENVEVPLASSVPDITYLKVAHHGSRYSSSSPFLKKADPEVAVISVGEDNSYGHPSPEALKRLEAAGARIFRTDEDGEVILTYDDGKVGVRTFVPSS